MPSKKVSARYKISDHNDLKDSRDLVVAEQFRVLFEADKRRLYSYIHAFVRHSMAADDIFQETCLTLCKEFEKFEIGTNFSKWANAIAYRRVLAFHHSHKEYALGLSDDFLNELSETYLQFETLSDQQEQKLRHLEQCISLLSLPLRQVYHRFYEHGETAHEIAAATGRSIPAIRKVVHKIRKRIFDCVDEKELKDSR